jgi:hypothetical protein
MQFIPLFKVRDMRVAIRHYTEVLDFVMTWPEDTPDSPVVDLGHEEMELQITTHESERLFGSVVYMWVADVDALFAKYFSAAASIPPADPIHRYTRGQPIRPGGGGNSMSPTRTVTPCAIANWLNEFLYYFFHPFAFRILFNIIQAGY